MDVPASLVSLVRERALREQRWVAEDHGRGSVLVEQGVRSSDILVLTSGLVKLTYLTASGDEWIKSFVVDKGVFGALDGEGARFGACTIEASTVARLPATWVRTRIADDPRLAEAAAAFDAWLLQRKQRREEALLCDSAEERYRGMQAREADLLARLPQGDVARFLRVTPIAFSRIKRRLRSDRPPEP